MQSYSRANPYSSRIIERYPLTKPGSSKDTRHVALDLGDSGMEYDVGDCVAILPINVPDCVENTLKALNLTGDETFTTRFADHPLSLRSLLEHHLNIANVPKKLLELTVPNHPLLDPSKRTELKEFLAQYELWDFLEEFPFRGDLKVFVESLQALLPRFYSIASHNATVGNQIDLTLAHMSFETRGILRWGVCTHYLCNIAVPFETPIRIYLHPHKGFTLPEDSNANIIMIGPGTGIAPYRGFMQKRIWRGDTGKSWLFFGECNQATDFFYEDFWHRLEKSGQLKLSTAFSRDQANKIYVQHRLQENAAELFQWIANGAYIFLCGDASHMAKDVEHTLLNILSTEGKMDMDTAQLYLKNMRLEKKYLKDVY